MSARRVVRPRPEPAPRVLRRPPPRFVVSLDAGSPVVARSGPAHPAAPPSSRRHSVAAHLPGPRPAIDSAVPGEVLDATSGPFERRYAVRPARRS